MKRLALVWLVVVLSQGCAIGSRIDDAVEEIEGTLDSLDADMCMEQCRAEAQTCWDETNGDCVDTCELDDDVCDQAEDDCLDQAEPLCWNLSGAAYHQCMKDARDSCDMDCDDTLGDCVQACGDEAADCLLDDDGMASCTADCLRDLQDDLKSIDL